MEIIWPSKKYSFKVVFFCIKIHHRPYKSNKNSFDHPIVLKIALRSNRTLKNGIKESDVIVSDMRQPLLTVIKPKN